jgi:hypothetical protein
MGIRGELYSTRVGCEGRTYFFNVKENRMGDMFLTVVESKPNESEGFERRSVVIFREDLQQFLKAFQGALDFMAAPPDGVAAKEGAPAAATVAYAPKAGSAAARKPKAPSGFAGAAPAAGAADPAGGPARKKKIVVKRKSSPPAQAGED